MSLFGSSLHDPGDLFMASAMRQMRQMNGMMGPMFDPFGMMGDMGMSSMMGPMGGAMMPFMGGMEMGGMGPLGAVGPVGSVGSFSSSTVVMSSGPGGRPQVYSSTSTTKVGPGGVKETRRTVQDSRTGTKKMAIGHHIADRAHVIEREQNLRSGDLEERQEFINIDEEEAEEFDREFQVRSRGGHGSHSRPRLMAPPSRQSPQRALPAPPTSSRRSNVHGVSSRRPIRPSSTTLALPSPSSSSGNAGVRHTYGSVQPQRSKQRGSKSHHSNPDY